VRKGRKRKTKGDGVYLGQRKITGRGRVKGVHRKGREHGGQTVKKSNAPGRGFEPGDGKVTSGKAAVLTQNAEQKITKGKIL